MIGMLVSNEYCTDIAYVSARLRQSAFKAACRLSAVDKDRYRAAADV